MSSRDRQGVVEVKGVGARSLLWLIKCVGSEIGMAGSADSSLG